MIDDVVEDIDKNDADWQSSAFKRALGDALFYGFQQADADVIMLKWKMLGSAYDQQPSLHLTHVDSEEARAKDREAYQTRMIFHWMLEQHERIKHRSSAVPMSKEEYFGRAQNEKPI